MPTWSLLVGDVRDRLADLKAGSVQCVVTSPPYWGLRDYGTATWEGGDSGCDHVRKAARSDTGRDIGGRGGNYQEGKPAEIQFTDRCDKCGARRIDAQIGLEPTPEEYVANMVAVFRDVRRVLRADGTLWLNLGDSYVGGRRGQEGDLGGLEGSRHSQAESRRAQRAMTTSRRRDKTPCPRSDLRVNGLKPKDLVGMPWRVAFALQTDGWWLRADIIWAKPNPMPESITDRPTKAHEYLFLLARSKRYQYDADAIKEPMLCPSDSTPEDLRRAHNSRRAQAPEKRQGRIPSGWDHTDGDHRSKRGRYRHDEAAKKPDDTAPGRRNKRSVWTIPTQRFDGPHFATFPTALVEPCVKAGSKPGDTVLDPFAGSGTTLVVAIDHGRNAIGIELNPEYAELARKRLRERNPLFATEVTQP